MGIGRQGQLLGRLQSDGPDSHPPPAMEGQPTGA